MLDLIGCLVLVILLVCVHPARGTADMTQGLKGEGWMESSRWIEDVEDVETRQYVARGGRRKMDGRWKTKTKTRRDGVTDGEGRMTAATIAE